MLRWKVAIWLTVATSHLIIDDYIGILILPESNIENCENQDYSACTDIESTVSLEDVEVDRHALRVLYLVKSIRTEVETDGCCNSCHENHRTCNTVNCESCVEVREHEEYYRQATHSIKHCAPEQLSLDSAVRKLVSRLCLATSQ